MDGQFARFLLGKLVLQDFLIVEQLMKRKFKIGDVYKYEQACFTDSVGQYRYFDDIEVVVLLGIIEHSVPLRRGVFLMSTGEIMYRWIPVGAINLESFSF